VKLDGIRHDRLSLSLFFRQKTATNRVLGTSLRDEGYGLKLTILSRLELMLLDIGIPGTNGTAMALRDGM
jgi:hypothetical protein